MTLARRRRRLGTGLIAFGGTGIVLVIAAALLVLGSLGAVGDAATGFDRQRTEILSMLEPAAAALSDAGNSASHAGASLSEASDASRRAADLTERLATSFQGMAGLGALEIFGTRPFAAVASQFTDVAGQSVALSADLTSTADALATNVADSQSVAGDLQDLADRLRQLETTLQASGGSGGSSGSVGLPVAAAEVVLLGLLAWLLVPAVVSIWLGARLVQNRPVRLGVEG